MSRARDRYGASAESPEEDVGRIVGHYGVAVEVRLGDGERRRVRVQRRSGHVVGDLVRVVGERLEALPRETVLRRHNPRGRVLSIASNLDVLGIVVAPVPISPPGFVDRAVVAARAASIEPFLVVNKCDLSESVAVAAQVRETYPGLITFEVSAVSGAGLDGLRRYLAPGRRGAFVGTSGVGKSHLLNALCPGVALEVGEINPTSGLGRHVTTRSTLLELPDGGELIDTPGFREFGPVELAPAELARHFPGFSEALEARCRYGDCLHRAEPGCRVREAIEAGRIAEERHATYLRLLAELEERERAQRRY